MPRVFISYARIDEKFVLKLAQDLRDKGVDLWLDQLDIAPDKGPWDDQVEAALKACPYFLVVLSPRWQTAVEILTGNGHHRSHCSTSTWPPRQQRRRPHQARGHAEAGSAAARVAVSAFPIDPHRAVSGDSGRAHAAHRL